MLVIGQKMLCRRLEKKNDRCVLKNHRFFSLYLLLTPIFILFLQGWSIALPPPPLYYNDNNENVFSRTLLCLECQFVSFVVSLIAKQQQAVWLRCPQEIKQSAVLLAKKWVEMSWGNIYPTLFFLLIFLRA